MNEGIYEDVPEDPSTGGPPRRRRFRLHRRPATLITTAARSASENRHHRERVYAAIQIARVPLLVLCGLSVFWWENWWVTGILFLISVPLPAVAVVIANEKGERRDPRSRNVYKPAIIRELAQQQELEEQTHQELSAREEPETIEAEDDDSGSPER
ncbi:DUF3099 domain-containing protein [Corynebacterium sp. A21]|uniref:DUF3099 domain-containing protein n=1 Tax=Corynebacterium sp. A21 TaxID=3457318 RepID=UPI003FD58E68